MAQKPIQSSDIASSDVFTKLIAETKELLAYYDQLDESVGKTAASFQQMAKGFKSNVAGDLQKVVAAEKELTVAIVEQEKRERAKIQTKKTLIGLEEKQAKALEREKKAAADLNNVYKQESKYLNELRNNYKNLAAAGRENGKVARGMLKEITRLDTKLKAIDKTVGQSQRNVGNYSSALDGLKGTMNSLLGVASKLGLTIGAGFVVRDGFNTLVSYDEKLADIAKTTGLSVEAANELSQALLKLDTRTSVENLQELAVAAGRLGIKGKDDILAFAEVADKVFVALGDDLGGTADEIATSLGKIADNFGATEQYGLANSIEMTGSAINELAANSKASASDILEFTNRLTGVAAQSGLTIPQVQALGALFSDTGQSIEVASTTLNVLLPKLAEEQEHFAKVAGMTSEAFGMMLKNNPVEALIAVAKGAESSSEGLVGLVETLESFGVESARATSIVGVLSGETDKLNGFIELGTNAFIENTSAQNEFNIKNQTTGALLEKLKKEWDKQVLGIGATTKASEMLKGSLSFLIRNLGTIITTVASLVKGYIAYKATVFAVTTVQKGYNLVLLAQDKGLKNLIKSLFTVTTSTQGAATAQRAFNVALKANPIGLVVTALVTLGSELDIFVTKSEKAIQKAEELNQVFEKGFESGQKAASPFDQDFSNLVAFQEEKLKVLKVLYDDLIAEGGTREEVTNLMAQTSSVIKFEAGQQIKLIEEMILVRQEEMKTLDRTNEKDAERFNFLTAELSVLEEKLKNFEEFKSNIDQSVTDALFSITPGSKKKIKQTGKIIKKQLTGLEKQRSDLLVAQLKAIADEEAVTDAYRKRQLTNEQKEIDDLQEKLYTELELAGENNELKLLLEEEYQSNVAAIRDKYRLQEEEEEKKAEQKQLELEEKQFQMLRELRQTEEENEIDRLITSYEDKFAIAMGNAELEKALEEQLLKDIAEIQEKYDDQEKYNKQVEAQKTLAQEVVDITTWLTDRRIEELDRLAEVEQRKFEESKDRENQIIELRKAGAINTEESLAYEREAQAKALAEQERIAKKKRRLELFNTSLNLMNSYVQQGNVNSLGKTISDITALTSFINTLPTFWTGTDTTVGDAVGKQFSNGRDGILARVDKSEMILNKGKVDTLAKYGIHSTDGIIQAIESNRLRATPLSAMPMVYDDKRVVERLERQEALLQKIANRPVESTDIEKISNTIKITQTLMQGNKVTTTTKNLRP